MPKLPAFQFYPGDWLKDPAVRAVSLAARGLWIDMLCLMHESSRRGYLQHASGKPVTAEQLARMTGCSTDEVSRLLQELDDAGVFSCTEHGVIYSRRMVHDEHLRQVRSSAGRVGAEARLLKQNRSKPQANGQANVKQSAGSSSSSSSSNKDPPLLSLLENSKPVAVSSSIGAEAKQVCSAPADDQAVVLSYPCRGPQKNWHLTEKLLAELSQDFPGIDVLAEARKARAWLLADRQRQKTAKGMRRFLVGWLGRAADRQRSPATAKRRDPFAEELPPCQS